MPTITPTDEQKAVIAAAKGSKSLLVNALAGSAKTTTLVMAAHAMPLQPTFVGAFNKKIAEELGKRMPAHITCSTMNSIGHRVWQARVGHRLIVETDKGYNILQDLIKQLRPEDREYAGEGFSSMLRAVRLAKSAGYVPEKFKTLGHALCTPEEFEDGALASSDIEPNKIFWQLVDEALCTSIAQGFEGKIDFDDQIYLSSLFGGVYPKYPVVMIDEAQDLSPLNHRTLELMFDGRIVAVGDPCQPPGTLVPVVRRVADAWKPRIIEQVPIENVKEGDTLVGYDMGYSEFFYNRKCLGVSERQFKGNLIRVVTEHTSSLYTPNHKCVARFSRLRNRTALYLMRSGSRWRVGTASMSYGSTSGPIARANAEKADALWILDTFEAKQEALTAKAVVQATYGIPDIIFEWAGMFNENGYSNRIALQAVWEKLKNIDFTIRAKDLLEAFGRDIDYPLWDNTSYYTSLKRPMVVRACNLLNGGEVLPFAGSRREKLADWIDYELRYEPYEGPVFSLSVSHNKLYVADGLVTHNCQAIYAFRGASTSSMAQMKTRFSMEELTLSVSFRCPKAVVRFAQKRAPAMKWPEWAIEGQVTHLSEWTPQTPPDGSAVICRNNAPLMKTAMYFIRHGRGIKMLRNDIGASLVKLLKKMGKPQDSREVLIKNIEDWREKEVKKASKSREGPIHDRADCLLVFAEESETLQGAIAFAEHLFAASGPVQFMTGHGAKGAEFDNVYHLDPFLIPSKWAKRLSEESGDDSALEQEHNLSYVITTRAKMNLFLVNSEDLI